MMRAVLFAVLALSVAACDPPEPELDAGSCTATVTVGTSQGGVFTAASDGDPAELVLGFQGFRMLQLALEVSLERGLADEAEVSAFVTVPETDVELSQRTREPIVRVSEGAFAVDDWLVFFNDVPPSEVVGRPVQIEVVVRAAGCVGGTTSTLTIRDDDDCVDPTIMVDAGFLDGGVGDASVCEGAAP